MVAYIRLRNVTMQRAVCPARIRMLAASTIASAFARVNAARTYAHAHMPAHTLFQARVKSR
eukprot:4916255-Pleurochrysis_carterae.AAC.2